MNDFRQYEYIEHYGVKGMHWGIRRYQNKDGSLTPLGKELAKQEKSEEEEKVKTQYDKKTSVIDRKIQKLNDKLSKNSENNRVKKKKDYLERMKKTVNEISDAERKAIRNTDWSDISKIKRQRTAAAVGKTIAMNALGILALETVGIGMFGVFHPNKNISSDAERQNIYYKNFAGTKWENGYNMSQRYLQRYK